MRWGHHEIVMFVSVISQGMANVAGNNTDKMRFAEEFRDLTKREGS